MAIVLNGTSGITTPGLDAAAGNTDLTTLSVAGNEISAVNSLGFRNRIINGGMTIDQRNAGASVSMTGVVYPVDRWLAFENTDGTMTAQQSAVTPDGFNTSVLITTTSADASLAAGQYARFTQLIEGLNVADLNWGATAASAGKTAAPITLSFWVRSSLTGTFGGALNNSAFDRSYAFTYTISSSNTWEQKSITISGDTAGTWLTTNGVGIALNFGLGAGSTFNGTAGAWASAGYLSATGATSVVGTNGATFYITGVQLEAGSVASPFERVNYTGQLAMCQRYYTVNLFAVYPPTYVTTVVPYKVNMRATPTISGGGAGFAVQTQGTELMQVYQTSLSYQTIVSSAEL